MDTSYFIPSPSNPLALPVHRLAQLLYRSVRLVLRQEFLELSRVFCFCPCPSPSLPAARNNQ